MLTPEWQLAHDKVHLARQREQITHEQLQACLGANTPLDAMRRLHASQRYNAAFTHQQPIKFQPTPTPKPPVMNRTLGTIVGTIAGIIACGFVGFAIASIIGTDPSTGTGIGSLVGLPVGIAIGRYFTRPQA